MGEALGGFAAPTHWDGDGHCIDWYPGPRGTAISWHEGGTVYYTLTIGPDGESDPMQTAYLVGDSGYVYSFTHVENIAAGRREAWEDFATVGRSGINTLPGDPDHIHFTMSYQHGPWIGPDGPTGQLDELLGWLGRMGYQIEQVDRIPGPQDYLAGRAVAGRFA